MIHLFDRGNNFVTTIPDPIIASYQKANRSLWSMKFSLHSSNPLIPKIEPMFFVDLEDDSGEYIGKFRVLPTQEVVNQSTNEIEYTCHHAFHTLLDSVIFEEKEFEDVQPAVVMKWLLDRQKTPHWIYVDSPNLPNVASIKIEKQTGLLESAYDVLEALPVQYYFDFDTTVMPWRVSIKESTAVSSRLKEGYNLDSFEITKDPSVLINRLYLESSYYDEEQKKDILVTLKEANNGVLYLENSDLVDTYGPIEWYEKVDGIKTSAGLKKYGTSMMARMSGLVTTIRGDGYDFLKIMDPPIDIDTLRIGRKVFFETEEHGTYYLYVTEEAKSDVFGAPHSISITLSLTGDNKTSASVTKSIFSSIKNAKKTAINALISADGKSLNTYSPYEPDYGNEGDTWFRENTDGSIDILIYKNGDWQEETSKAIFKKVQDQLDTSAKDIEDARLEAEKASLEAENAAKGLIELDTNITNVIAEVNAATERLGTAEEDIANVLSDLDPLSTDPSTTAFKINETRSDLEGISARLVDYAKTTDLEGLATEEYAINIAKAEAGKVSQALASYAKTTDVDGKIQTLTKNVNSQISTVEGNYTTLSQKFSQIGGRNLLEGSAELSRSWENDAISYYQYLLRINIISILPKVQVGDTLTISMDVEIEEGMSTTLKIYDNNGNPDIRFGGYTTPMLTGGKQRISFTKTLVVSTKGSSEWIMDVYNFNNGVKFSFANVKIEKGSVATDWTPAPEDIEADLGALGKDIEDVQADVDGKIQTLTENVNSQISTAEGNYTTLAQKVNDQVTKITSISQTVDGQQSVIADLKGETGLMSLSNIRQSIDEHKSQLVSLAESSMSQVNVDAKEVPIVPYKKGQLWAKGFYDFTQGYDVIKSTDEVTLGEFANAGLFRAKNDRLEGGFEWNDWERVSADPRFQMSDITQRLDSITSTVINNERNAMSQIRQIANEITSTVKEGDLLSAINQRAGNVLIQVGTKSKLNITEAGTYMDTNFVKSSHIADAAITAAKIGNAQIIGAKIANATITSAKIASLDVAKISGNISNFIQTNWNAINSSISITGTQLVASHTDGTKTILDATGLYTQVGSSKYRHSYLTYANHALKLNNTLDAPKKITLPAIWKGRKFEVMVSLASTDGFIGLANDYVLRRITVGHNINTRDFVNATFEMYGYAEYVHITTKKVVKRYVDARYLVVQTF